MVTHMTIPEINPSVNGRVRHAGQALHEETDLTGYFLSAAIQKLRHGEPLSPNSLTPAYFGKYLGLISDWQHTCQEAIAKAESEEATGRLMEDYWILLRKDPTYVDLVAAIDQADVQLLAQDGYAERTNSQEIDDDSATTGDTDETIARLAALSPIEYDRAREAEAQALGIRVSTLDRMVAQARGNGEDPAGQGHAITFADDEETPWPAPVDGARLLDAIAETCKRYAVLPRGGNDAVTLWTVHTHAHDEATVSPILALESPQKRCGKTTTLQIVSSMVARALSCSNITPAAIFRTVERYRPTLILDEADTYLRPEHDDLRGILNSGHARGSAHVIRTVGDDHEPRRFSTWCPKAIALIGSLPTTLADRSITLHLQRKAPGQTVERWRIDHADSLADLRRMARRWVADHHEALATSDPGVPHTLHDRAADNWRPLLAIADVAGGDWPERARQAIQAIESIDPDGDDVNGLLLRDLRDLFAKRAADRLTSADICERLASQDDRPWPTVCHGKPITAHRLARMLAGYGVSAKQIRIGEHTMKGYMLDDLNDTFLRYTTSESETSKQGRTGAASEAKSKRNTTSDVSLSKSPGSPDLTRHVSMFRFESGDIPEERCPHCGNNDWQVIPGGDAVCRSCARRDAS
jgi:Protein of unknown function (DUF3631)